MLANVASKLKSSPNCSITILVTLAQAKLHSRIVREELLLSKHTWLKARTYGSERISTDCQVGGGDANTVDIKVKHVINIRIFLNEALP